MATVAWILSALVAAILLWAGLDKGRDLAPLASTMNSLGIPARLIRPGAQFLVVAEISVAIGLIFTPDSALTQAGIIALALVFAVAGIVARLRGERIHCSCFAGFNVRLGFTQMIALVPWLGVAVFLHLLAPDSLDASSGAARLALVGLAIGGARGIVVWFARNEARGDRLCAREMFLWPR